MLDATVARLRQDILRGVLAPGSRLRMGELRARYGVSGSPLREALSRLVGSGLIRAEPQRGFAVAGASREDLRDITRARQAIESEALRLAMANGDESWESAVLAAFHTLARRTERGDYMREEAFGGWEEAHRVFHKSLIAACGSGRLIAFQETLYDQALRYRALVASFRPDREALIAEHRALMQAVLSGDAEGACETLRRHLALTADLIMTADAAAGVIGSAEDDEGAAARREEVPRQAGRRESKQGEGE